MVYDYIFENTHSISVIGTNKKKDTILDRITVNRKMGIQLRNGYKSMYSMR